MNWLSLFRRWARLKLAAKKAEAFVAKKSTQFYPTIDIIVNPRKLTSVTSLVSSLKSIEAMAYGKPLVLSDIPPHQELLAQAARLLYLRLMTLPP